MKVISISCFLFLLFCFPHISYSQNYQITNKNEKIELTILNDSIRIQINNTSDKSIFLPVENILKQQCSENKSNVYIEFGIDLVPFTESMGIELFELSPETSKIFYFELKDCNYNNIYFIYQFYMRSYLNDKKGIIFNSEFAEDENFLMTGDWEWGELNIDTK